jgi:ribose transport system ATP-binding protein
MMVAPSRLCVRALHKRFGPTQALDGVHLDVAAGEVHALVGENGAGKSTLLKALAGVHLADTGSMEIDGMMHMPMNPAEAGAAGLAIIHQELALAPHLSIAENLFLGREPRRGLFVDRVRLREQAKSALRRVGRDWLDPDQLVATLPPADRQLIEIARALTQDVRVLVLDEPTSSLTQKDVAPLLQRLRDLAKTGVAVVYVSHVFEEIFAVADRYTVLRDGQTAATGAIADVDHDDLVAAMVGRNVEQLYHRNPSKAGEVVIELRQLAGRVLPVDAALELRRGEVLGIAGLVGAGRTELLRCVFGLDEVISGKIRVLAQDGWMEPRQRWLQGVGLLSEDRKQEGLALSQSLAENLWLPSLSRKANRGLLSARQLDGDAADWLQRVGVKFHHPSQAIAELSGGNQQKVALARLLAADSDVLLLDEPTRGIDVGAKAEIYRMIDSIAHEQQKAVLVVSSYLPELLGLADRIAVVARGDVLLAQPVEDWDEHKLLIQMTAGRQSEGIA